jgi:hypothetical protein
MICNAALGVPSSSVPIGYVRFGGCMHALYNKHTGEPTRAKVRCLTLRFRLFSEQLRVALGTF